MKVLNDLLWVAFAAIWLAVLVVGLITAVDGGHGFWNGIRTEHHTLLLVAVATTGARITWSYSNWKEKHDATR